MMGTVRLCLAVICSVLLNSCLGAVLPEDNAAGVGYSMCCPEGMVLKIVVNTGNKIGAYLGHDKLRGDDYIAKCVQIRNAPKDSLNESPISVSDKEEMMELQKKGVWLPDCTLGRKFHLVSLKNPDSFMESSGSEDEEETSGRVKLGDFNCEQGRCQKGNVYVDDKPVCDDGWDDTDAEVVCKELGFKSGGRATGNSYFGRVDLDRQSGWDQVSCKGHESSLVECEHEPVDDCGDYEGAGVFCMNDAYDALAVPLTSAGDLVLPDNTTYSAGEYCLAEVYQGDKEVQEEQVVAVMCEPCKSEVLCSILLLDLFEALKYPGDEIVRDDFIWGANNIVLAGDRNKDGKVNFVELKSSVEDYVKKIFNILDEDGDGVLDQWISIKSLSTKFFLQLLDEFFLFFDVNQDNMLSVDDAPPRAMYHHDKNDDGKISLEEVFGMSIINFPAPLDRLYSSLDRDKNEKISIEEATIFLKGALAMVDRNEDCHINVDEFIKSLDECNLPKEYQLAVKLLADQYFEILDFILREFVAAVDTDGDKKTTLEEVIGFKDPAALFKIFTVATTLIFPNMSAVSFIIWDQRFGHNFHMWNKQQEVVEMWLNVLYTFLDNKKFQSPPSDFCGK